MTERSISLFLLLEPTTSMSSASSSVSKSSLTVTATDADVLAYVSISSPVYAILILYVSFARTLLSFRVKASRFMSVFIEQEAFYFML